ncbi:putative efflux pump antibiotic resistance protein [Thozetella sp. PMI_491]|nr:putative efflux pump antibiotic resistance protein [Thozetella sp. PMI_491]
MSTDLHDGVSGETKVSAHGPKHVPEGNDISARHFEGDSADHDKSGLQALEEEDDPHVAAFREDTGPHSGSGNDITWVISGWGIASSVSFAIAGRLSDIFGRRYVILLGEVLAVVGAIVAATSPSVPALVAGSTVLGLSVGLILVIFTAVPELCPYKYRGVGLAWVEFCLFVPWGAAAALLSNLLNEHASWRWIYYIAIIYAAISLIGTALFYFPPSKGLKSGSTSRWEAFKQLDFLGIALYTAGLVLFLLGLAWGGTDGHAWNSASVIAPLVIGIATLIACFAYEFMLVDDSKAFFPLHLFRKFREFTVLLIVSFVAGMVYYPCIALLPQATLFLFTNDTVELGIILLPNSMGQFFGSTVIPALLHLSKAPKFFIVLATFLMTLFTGLYVYALHGHKGAWMAFQFFGQGCFDWITTCTIVNASLHVRYSDMGLAVGLLGAFRSFGGSVGNAIFQAILSSVLDSRLGPGIADAALSNGFPSSDLDKLIPAVINSAAGAPDAFVGISNVTSAVLESTAAACRDAYAYAFERVFYATIPFGVLALIAAFFIADAGKYMTNHTAVHMERNVLGRKEKA